MKKKVLALILALCMSVGLLAGCGGSDGSSGNQTGANTSATNSGNPQGGESSGEIVNLVMEYITPGFEPQDLQMVEDALNQITEEKIGVHITFMTVPIGNMATKLGLLVAGNEQIDMTVAGLLTSPAELVAQGLLQPITEYVEKSEVLSKIGEGIIDACKVNGEIYAFPTTAYTGGHITFYYDKDLAEQYNIKVADYYPDQTGLTAVFEQVKASGMDQYGLTFGDGTVAETSQGIIFDELGNAMCGYGVVMDVRNGTKVENYYATNEYLEKCRLHRSWFEAGYAVPDSMSNNYTVHDSMSQGICFGYFAQGSADFNDVAVSGMTQHNIKSAMIGDNMIKGSGVFNFSFGVPTTSKHPDKVVEFLELTYTDPDVANLLNYGIEGVHYEKNGDSKIIHYPEGVHAGNVGYSLMIGTYGDSAKTYKMEPLTEEIFDELDQYKYPNCPASRFMGYTFDPSSVSTEVTAVTAVIMQYAPALECGIVDPDQMIPEFLNALQSAGMDKIIAENQAQLDTWLANK